MPGSVLTSCFTHWHLYVGAIECSYHTVGCCHRARASARVAAQEHRLHTAESAAMHYRKRDGAPGAGADGHSARAYAAAYDKRAAKVRAAADALTPCRC